MVPLFYSAYVITRIKYQVLFPVAFNLILCYHAIGDREKLKRGFQRLLKVQENGEDDEDRYYPTVVCFVCICSCVDTYTCTYVYP